MGQNLAIALPPQPSRQNGWQPSKMSWWYHSIIDFMLANPQSTKREMAKAFNCSEAAIVLITTSDIFRAHFDARRAEFSSQVDGAITSRLGEVALKSLGLMMEVLEKKQDQVPLMQLNEIVGGALTRLGYGLKPDVQTPAPSVRVEVNSAPQQTTLVAVPVSPQDLEAARNALRRSEALKLIESHEVRARPIPEPEPLEEAGGILLEGETGVPICQSETALVDASQTSQGEEERRDEPLL
jgi:hypothetical protein